MSEDKNQSLPRRNFLKGMGALAAGAVAGAGTLAVLMPKPALGAAPAVPWPYQALNLDTVRKRAYENYWIGGCCYATAKSLLDTLIETVGTPWDSIPADMFKFGKGGALSWGTLCGALNGSLYIMTLAAGTGVDGIGNELIGWYTTNPFPSTLMDSYAMFKKQRQTIADSPLCHQSVSIWCYATHNEVNSDQKKDRCAKVAGDTAARAAELLNQWKAGTFSPVYQPAAEFAGCMTCHTGPSSTLDDEQGKANCVTCHDDKVENHP